MNLIELYLLTHICFWNVDLRVHPLTTIISPIRRFVVYISLSPICQRTYKTFVSRFQRYYYFFIFQKKLHLFFVPRVGFEPTTHRLEICCSIQLSYRGIYVFLIKYNKKIKNCFFFKELSCFSRFQRYYSFLRLPNFFSTFFYFFPVTYCFYGTSVYVTFVTFRTNIWRKLMNNVFLTV